MNRILQDYLSAPAQKRDETIKEILRQPERAFEALLFFQGPYPSHLHVIDVFPDYLEPLLFELINKFPHLLLTRDLSKLDPGHRQILISLAIDSKNPEFASTILAALKDRSTYVRELAVKAISRLSFLQTPETRNQFEKLKTLQSMDHFLIEIDAALNGFGNAAREKDD